MVAGRPQCWAPLPPSLTHRGGEGGDGAPPYRAGPPLGWSECPDQGSHGSSWFVRLHLLTRVCSCTDMSGCILVHTCAHAHTCLQAHVDVNTQVPTCIFVCLPVCPCVSVFTGTRADGYTHMCAHVPSHMHTRAHLHVPHVHCMSTHVCVCGISASSPPSLREPAGLTVRPPSVPPAGLVRFPTRSAAALGTCCGKRRGSGRLWAHGVGGRCQGR